MRAHTVPPQLGHAGLTNAYGADGACAGALVACVCEAVQKPVANAATHYAIPGRWRSWGGQERNHAGEATRGNAMDLSTAGHTHGYARMCNT